MLVRGVLALWLWTWLVWTLLTWTLTAEQLAFGAGLSLVVAVALAPVGDVAAPWRLLHPRVLYRVLRLGTRLVISIVRANVVLAWRVWHPRPPIRTGMVIVPTELRTEGGLAGVGLLTSLVVDNQIVDINRRRHELLYHAVVVPPDGEEAAYDAVNGPIERHLRELETPHD